MKSKQQTARLNQTPQETILVKLSDDGQEFTLFWSGTDLGPYALQGIWIAGARLNGFG